MKRIITFCFLFLASISLGNAQGIVLSHPVSYLGVVATRGTVPTNFTNTFTTWMTRSAHFSRDTITSLKIIVPNFYVDVPGSTFVELGTGATTTVTASIEYPQGTFTQIKFSGSASGSVTSGSYLVSDATAIAIPNNTQFWVRMYMTNPNGQVYDGSGFQGNAAIGDACNTFDGDKTLSGTVSSQFPGYMTAPLAIIAQTLQPSVELIGTSRMAGLKDVYTANNGDLGIAARSIGPSFGYIQAGIPSDTVPNFIASHTNRVALSQYVSHVIAEGPTNNAAGTSNGQLQQYWGFFPPNGNQVFAITCDPETTSSDSWATSGNQTVSVNYSTVNAFMNTLPLPILRSFDITTVTATANKWNVDGTANKWTADGIHESQFTNLQIQASGVILASAFYR
jgi:hypothetical protein